MDEAGATRRAALDAVRDIEPAGLYDRIEGWLDNGSMVPGVLTIHCARTKVKQSVGESELRETLAERAAGVQLIYDGLRLTRMLSKEEPWTHGEGEDADLDILVADVLVARGFYLLARTGAAEKAVETVRAFGRDQTVGRETGDRSVDRNLEADALELAVIAGSDFGNAEVPTRFREYASERASELAESSPAFPPAAEFFSESDLDWFRSLQAESGGGDGLTTSVDD